MTPPTPDLVVTHRAKVVSLVTEHEGWPEDSYEIELLEGWDHDRLPVLAVNTNRLLTEYAPLFAALPSGRLIPLYEEDALKAIVSEVLPSPAAGDGLLVARLATMFGRFEQPVGEVTSGFPLGPPASGRSSTEVVYSEVEGRHQFDFYAFDHERMRLYDCRVTIGASGVELRSTAVPPRDP